jgi:hypothetical protein
LAGLDHFGIGNYHVKRFPLLIAQLRLGTRLGVSPSPPWGNRVVWVEPPPQGSSF